MSTGIKIGVYVAQESFFARMFSPPEPIRRSRWSCRYNPQPIYLVAKIPPFLCHRRILRLHKISPWGRGSNVLMTFICSLTPTRFSEVNHSGVVRVFYKLVKCSTITQAESKQNALSNFRGIVNALCALEDNRLNNDYPLRVPLHRTDPIKFYRKDSQKSLSGFPRRCVIALGWYTNNFFHRACHLLPPLLLHPSGLLDFGASNPGRHHIACSRRRGGGRLGGLPLALKGRRRCPQRVGVAEVQQRPRKCLPGVSAAGKVGCWPAVWRHCLGSFPAGWSWNCWALEFWYRRCGRKAPLVVRVQQYRPLQLRAFPPVHWCVLQGPACWPVSWVSFPPTRNNLSHCHFLQYLPPTWHHCLGWRADWVTHFDCLLVERNLNLFSRSRRPPVQLGWGWCSWQLMGPRGRCRCALVGKTTCLLSRGRWVRTPVRLGRRWPGWWPGRG